MMEQLDLEVAGGVLFMGATLMQIKVRMLLPREVDNQGEEIDPRMDLVNALLEYKRYKEMAEELQIMESEQRKIFFRGYFEADKKEKVENVERLLKNITIYDLLKAFKKVLMDRKEEPVHQIEKFSVTIDEQIEFILSKIARQEYIHFLDLVKGMREKLRIIVTFIAMLELIKLGAIGLQETENFNDFVIYRIADGKDIQLGY
jgi:segregation and condensation protein A